MEDSGSSLACMVNEYVAPVWFYIAGIGLLPLLFRKRRALHEILSGTRIVPLAKWKSLRSRSATGSVVPMRIVAFLIDLTPWLIANQVLSECNVTFIFSGAALGICLILTTGLWGTSLGLWATGLGVRKGDRIGAPGIPRAVVRLALCVGPFLAAHWICWTAYADWSIPTQPWSGVFLCVALVSAGIGLFSQGKRGLHDRVCGTVVLPVPRQSLPRFRSTVTVVCALIVALDAAVVGAVIDHFLSPPGGQWVMCMPGPVLRLGIQDSESPDLAGNGTRSPAEIYELYRDRVVRIDVSCLYRRWWYAREEYPRFCGSGVIVANDDKHGLVVTNRHVVDSSFNRRHPLKKDAIENLEITVSNPNSNYRVAADVVALYRQNQRDPEPTDLALVLIPLDGWKPGAVSIASMESIRPGEDAVAIGCPYELNFSISEGLIAQLRPEENAVQTSCPISPGNSGGPLVLCDGGVLAGINTSTLVDERVQNINFAVRADLIADPEGWEYQGKDEKTVRKLLGMLRVKGKKHVKRCRRALRWDGHMEECAAGAKGD